MYLIEREDQDLCTFFAYSDVPHVDRRGNITSHRARATIASLYYNAPEGLTFSELQQFLGRRHSRSTQAYVKLSPTKLAKVAIVWHERRISDKKGEVRQRYREGQEEQLGALGLVVNAIVLWNMWNRPQYAANFS